MREVNVTFWGFVRDKIGERHGFNDFAEERDVYAVKERRWDDRSGDASSHGDGGVAAAQRETCSASAATGRVRYDVAVTW